MVTISEIVTRICFHFDFPLAAQNTTHKTQFQSPDAAAEERNGIKNNNLFPLVFCLCCFPALGHTQDVASKK